MMWPLGLITLIYTPSQMTMMETTVRHFITLLKKYDALNYSGHKKYLDTIEMSQNDSVRKTKYKKYQTEYHLQTNGSSIL